MVKGQVLSRTAIRNMSSEQIDRYIIEQLGLSPEDLEYIRSKDKFDIIYRSAEAIYSKTGNPVAITLDNIAAVASIPPTTVKRIIRGVYEEDVVRISSEYRLIPPPVSFLRYEVTGTELPFLEERKRWEYFEPSSQDWLRCVKLPLEIGTEEAELLGVYWGDGYINTRKPSFYINFCLQLCGRADDFEFYEEVVAPRMEKAHNIPAKVLETRVVRKFRGKYYDYTQPNISVSSKAIVTWLKDDLGFPLPKINVSLPLIEERECFLTGIIASMGYLSKEGYFCVYEKDRDFAENLRELSERLGFSPYSYRGNTNIIRFNKRDVTKMRFINPMHVLGRAA